MEFLLPIIFILFFIALIYWWLGPKLKLLPTWLLILLFIVKAGVGVYYGIWHKQTCGVCDTFMMFKAGNYIFEQIKEDPREYLLLTFYPNGTKPPHLIEDDTGPTEYWNNTSSYTVVRFNALVRLISFGNYHVHAIIIAFLSFLALLYLFRFLVQHFPKRKWLFLIILFLTPSILFYGSGVHKESFTIISLALIIPSFHHLMKGNRIKALWLVAGLFLLFLVKDFYLAAVIPCLLGWMVTFKRKKGVPVVFITIFISYWLSLFLISAIFPGFDIAQQIAAKQEEFRILVGNSNVFLPEINATVWGIIKLAPLALQHTLLRPWPAEANSFFLVLYMIENAVMLTFIIFTIVASATSRWRIPLFWFCLLFALASLIIIGVIVPNLGAISRYRVPAILFLLIGFSLLPPVEKIPFLRK